MKRSPFISGFIFLLVSIAVSLFLKLDWSQGALILSELRLPRMIAGVAIGGALAMTGAVLQTVLGNPLSEPYTLGIASGAALGAAVSSSFKVSLVILGLNGGAVLGALGVLFLLLKLVRHSGQATETTLLIGMMLSLLCSSLLSVWMALSDPVGVQSVTYWLLGDLSRVELKTALVLLAFTGVAAVFFKFHAKNLDAFLFGEKWVESFGVSYSKTQLQMVVVVSVLVSLCVSASGMIGFVGLMVPHWARRMVGPRHRALLPLVLVLGSATLTLSDGLARALSDPHELPVGAVTALLGAPLFILVLLRQKRKGTTVIPLEDQP